MIKVDLATRFLPADHRVYILHPGAAKKFYGEMYMSDQVYLDLPGANFENIDLSNESADLRKQVKLAREVRRWHELGKPENNQPSRNPEDYADGALSTRIARHVNSAVALFKTARIGDIVVVPGPGYRTSVLIGEVSADFNPEIRIESAQYPGELLPSRGIRWLSKRREKRTFSSDFIELMQNPRAIIQVSDEKVRIEVYKEAYQNFVLPGRSECRLYIEKGKIDLLALNRSSSFALYFSALYKAQELGELDRFLGMGIREGLETFYDPAYFNDTGISINSPGYIALIARTALLSVFIGLMVGVTAGELNLAEARNLQIVNSLDPVRDPCVEQIEDQYRAAMNRVNHDIWVKWCRENILSKNDVGLESHVKVQEIENAQ